jgi:hypothetical protein
MRGCTTKPLSAPRGEREGPDAKRREGEVGVTAGTESPPPHPNPLRPLGRRGNADLLVYKPND